MSTAQQLDGPDLTQLSDEDLRYALSCAARNCLEAGDSAMLAALLVWFIRNAQPSLMRELAKWLQEADAQRVAINSPVQDEDETEAGR